MNITRGEPVELTINEERLANIMQTLGDVTRFKIFKLMQSGREMCVSEIAETIGVSVSAISQHFRIFELIGIVDKERDGQKICYKLKKNDGIINIIKGITKDGGI